VVLIADNIGQLGNQIVRLAHFVAFAESAGVSVGHAHFERYAKYFPAFSGDPLSRYPRRTQGAGHFARFGALTARTLGPRLPVRQRPPLAVLRLTGPNEFDLSDPDFVELAQNARMVLVSGFLFRDYRAFTANADLLRRVFTPQAHHLERARSAVAQARAAGVDRVIGVHVRRGDYAQWNEGRYFWRDDEYAGLMRAASQHWPGKTIRFLVCSNDVWSPSAFPGDVVAGPGHELEDMYALAHCDAILGPPSTFTIWASFWGKAPLWSVSSLSSEPAFGVALAG
jgi:hypothetical protein